VRQERLLLNRGNELSKSKFLKQSQPEDKADERDFESSAE
jgi:hypothetical protein